MIKVLYLFSGSRKNRIGIHGVDCPETQLYGSNHFSELGISATQKAWDDMPGLRTIMPRLPFGIRHSLLFFLTKNYDIVFGSSLIYMMLWRKIFWRSHTKFVLLNTSLNRLLISNKHKRLKNYLIRACVNELDAIACLSRVQEQELRNLLGVTMPLFFVPLGVDQKYYAYARDGRKDFILSGGRDNGRDYATFMKVAEALPQQKFVLFCNPRNLVGVSQIPFNVEVCYDIDTAEARDLYQTAKLLLLTTHPDGYQDGSDCSGQTVLLDAMASGVPVIATRKAYLRDYVTDGQDALIAESGSIESIVSKITLLDTVQMRERMALRAREKVEQLFTSEKMAQNLAQVFKKLSL